jgi:phosphatidylglycerophosphate synthase
MVVILRFREGIADVITTQKTLQGATEESPKGELMNSGQKYSQTVIIVANSQESSTGFSPEHASVGTLPVLLRTILTVHANGASRIIISVPSDAAQSEKSRLHESRRLPSSVEWIERAPNESVSTIVGKMASTSEHVMVVFGNHIYQPRLLQSAMEWEGDGALALVTDREPAGIYVFSQSAALALANQSTVRAHTQSVDTTSWHSILTPTDLKESERKLDGWLVKPTDGVFARMNRRVSVPISRLLIKIPNVTANMVTLFVLAVSFAAGVFFASGGYWSTLVGAFLSVSASILDGCDGEVARIKLQSSKFGCWLETMGDYLYYLFIFGGMTLGLTRSSGNRSYLAWGAVLCFGAIMSFLVVSITRKRLSGLQPEKLLATWQKKAESRPSNPLLYLGRHCEFIIRRCFFPYALFFFALVNLTNFVFVGTAVGANIVWMIALYSLVTFSPARRSAVCAVRSASVTERAIA